MEFLVFVWVVAIVIFVFVGICSTIFGQLFTIVSPIKNNSLYIMGIGILSLGLLLYLPYSLDIWQAFNKILYPYLQKTNSYTYLLTEVWYTIVFFRNIWPSILIATIVVIIDNVQYPITSRYRMLKRFSHNKLLVMVACLFLFFITRLYNEVIANYFLSIALYSAIFYWRFGFSIVLYILKQSKIPYEVGMLLMIASTIIAGEYFLLPIVMFLGFGISDIWVDYYQRNAASLVFNFDYH